MSEPYSGKSVLIVDDSYDIRMELRETYESLGLRVAGDASNGMEALELLGQESIDIVSLDIIMPEMDGVECFHLIRQKHPEVECIFVSALAQDIRVIQAYEGTIDHFRFVPKPVSQTKISTTLNRVYLDEGHSPTSEEPKKVRPQSLRILFQTQRHLSFYKKSRVLPAYLWAHEENMVTTTRQL